MDRVGSSSHVGTGQELNLLKGRGSGMWLSVKELIASSTAYQGDRSVRLQGLLFSSISREEPDLYGLGYDQVFCELLQQSVFADLFLQSEPFRRLCLLSRGNHSRGPLPTDICCFLQRNPSYIVRFNYAPLLDLSIHYPSFRIRSTTFPLSINSLNYLSASK